MNKINKSPRYQERGCGRQRRERHAQAEEHTPSASQAALFFVILLLLLFLRCSSRISSRKDKWAGLRRRTVLHVAAILLVQQRWRRR